MNEFAFICMKRTFSYLVLPMFSPRYYNCVNRFFVVLLCDLVLFQWEFKGLICWPQRDRFWQLYCTYCTVLYVLFTMKLSSLTVALLSQFEFGFEALSTRLNVQPKEVAIKLRSNNSEGRDKDLWIQRILWIQHELTGVSVGEKCSRYLRFSVFASSSTENCQLILQSSVWIPRELGLRYPELWRLCVVTESEASYQPELRNGSFESDVAPLCLRNDVHTKK